MLEIVKIEEKTIFYKQNDKEEQYIPASEEELEILSNHHKNNSRDKIYLYSFNTYTNLTDDHLFETLKNIQV